MTRIRLRTRRRKADPPHPDLERVLALRHAIIAKIASFGPLENGLADRLIHARVGDMALMFDHPFRKKREKQIPFMYRMFVYSDSLGELFSIEWTEAKRRGRSVPPIIHEYKRGDWETLFDANFLQPVSR